MLRLALKLLLAGAAIAAVWAFVPVGGKTLAHRWSAARDPSEFVSRTWTALRGAPAPAAKDRPPAHARPGRARTAARPGRPTEGHTDSDRQALDRVLSTHLEE